MDKIREHAATHYAMVSLNQGNVDLDDEFTIEKPNGKIIETTIEEYLTETFIHGGFCSAFSQAAEDEWKKEWGRIRRR